MTHSSSTCTTNVVLVAALMLSSGVCLSEAFSVASSVSRLQLQAPNPTLAASLSRLYYAPKDSMDNSQDRPKRRRGRPRKATASSSSSSSATTTSTTPKRRPGRPTKTATAAASSDSDVGSTTTTGRSSNKKRSTTTKANRGRPSSAAANSTTTTTTPSRGSIPMLDHELLTKKEEQLLGKQIQRAIKVQESMEAWVEEQKHKMEQMERDQERMYNVNNYYNEEDDDEEEDDYLNLNVYGSVDFEDDDDMMDLNNPLMFGTAKSQAMERYWAGPTKEHDTEELYYPDGTPVEGDEFYGMSAYDSNIFEQHPQQPAPFTPETWMDDVLGIRRNSVDGTGMPTSTTTMPPLSDMMTTITITDDDVSSVLGLSGGRSELRSILLEGALARDKLIRSNVKLAMSIAQRWVGEPKKGTSSLLRVYGGGTSSPGSMTGRPTLDEAVQEGVMGLADAAERFDPNKGFRFSTYATVWVTNRIRKSFQLESTSGLRLPTKHYEIKRSYINRVRHYRNTQQSVPPMQVLAEDLNLTEKRLLTILRLTQPLASLDSPKSSGGSSGGVRDDNDGYTLASLLACDEPQPEHNVERSLLRQCLENAMATELSPNERDVVRLRLGLDDGVGRSPKEVATDCFGGRLTAHAIRAIEQRALTKLRSPYAVHTHNLMSYFDFAGIDGDIPLP